MKRVGHRGCLESKESELISPLDWDFSVDGGLVANLLLVCGDLNGCLQKPGVFALKQAEAKWALGR